MRLADRLLRLPPLAALLATLLLAADARCEAGRFGIIVHPEPLADAAAAWRDYRRADGWDIALVEVQAKESAEALRERLRALIAERPMASERRAILLLGDAPEAGGAGGVPTFRFEQTEPALLPGGEPTFPSDHPFALLVGEEESSAVALGRVPAATNDEALAVLAKIRRYEQSAPPGPWRHRVHVIAGEGHFGRFDDLLEMLFRRFVDELLPERFDLTMTYAKPSSPWCPPPEKAEATTLARLAEGSILFNYLGHGHEQGLDSLRVGGRRHPILRAAALGSLPREGDALPVALLACCSTGWFDLAPKDGRARRSLAEAMLAAPAGPIAVIAGTRPTHPYGNAVVQKEFSRAILGLPDRSLGEIDRRAREEILRIDASDRTLDAIVAPVASATRWKNSLDELRRMHVRMYVLFGDPMMEVVSPGATVQSLRIERDGDAEPPRWIVRGAVRGCRDGEVTLRVESDRDGHGTHSLRVATDGDDVAARTEANYPRANERLLWSTTLRQPEHAATAPDAATDAAQDAWAFAIPLPAPLPDGARILRVYATGRDAAGAPIEAIGGRRIPLR